MTFRDFRRRCASAYHESGHALAAVRLNGSVDEVSIVPLGRSFGRVRSTTSATKSPFERMQDSIIITLAGPAAHRRFDPRGWCRESGANDAKSVEATAALLCSSPRAARAFIKYAELAARDLVRNDWHVVKAIADALLADETIGGERLLAVVAEADASRARLCELGASHIAQNPGLLKPTSPRRRFAYPGPRDGSIPSRRDVAAAMLRAFIKHGPNVPTTFRETVARDLTDRGYRSLGVLEGYIPVVH